MKNVIPHKGMIYDISIKFTREQKHIEDNYSDALVAMFRYIETYNPQRDIKSWIYAVATRLIFDANKRNGRIAINHHINIDTVVDDLEGGGKGCNCMGVENYQEYYNDDILQALDTLSPIHKEALLLQQAGYKVDEIAEIAFQNGTLRSKSTETIKSRLYLAKQGMRQLININGERKIANE